MKNLAKLNGAKVLSEKEQKSINGGKANYGCGGLAIPQCTEKCGAFPYGGVAGTGGCICC